MGKNEKNIIETLLPLGLILWYPFSEGRALLQGQFAEDYVGALSDKGIVCDLEPQDDCKYDYILAISYIDTMQNPVNKLRQWKAMLAPAGHIFIAMENRFGLQFFCGDKDPYTDRVFDSIEGYRNYLPEDRKLFKGQLMGKGELEELLDSAELINRKIYSVLPGLSMPQQIYAESTYPNEQLDIRYTPIYRNPSTIFMNQGILYEGLIKNDLFHQTANAYLIDITVDGELFDATSITTSLDRGRERATATIIRESGVVEKKPLFQEGIKTTQELLDNEKYLENRGIKVVAMEAAGDCLVMPLVEGEIGTDYFRRIFFEDYEFFLLELDRFISLLQKSSNQIDESSRVQVLEEHGEYAELGPIYEKLFIDMVPLNCFAVDGDFIFFDQEFALENMPLSVVIARVIDIIYMGDRTMQALHPIEDLFKKYGIYDKCNAIRDIGHKFINNLRNKSSLEAFDKIHMGESKTISSNRERMNYSDEEINKFYEFPMNNTDNKDIYIFGTGNWAKHFIGRFGGYCNIEAAIDNNPSKWGQDFCGIKVISTEELKRKDPESYKIIICVKYFSMILSQLKSLGVKNYSAYDVNRDWPEFVEFYRSREITDREKAEKVGKTESEADGKDAEIGHYGRGYVAGVFDLFHMGHLNVLRRAKEHCDYLIVGVVSDQQASMGKAHSPYVSEQERLEIVRACRYVDEAFIINPLAADSRTAYYKYNFDVQFSGSDYEKDPVWLSEREWLREHGSDLVFFPYTQSTSSTKLKAAIEGVGK